MKQKVFKKSISFIMSALICVSSAGCAIAFNNSNVNAMDASRINNSRHLPAIQDYRPVAEGQKIIDCFPANNPNAYEIMEVYALANYVYKAVLDKENQFNTQYRLTADDVDKINNCLEIDLDGQKCEAIAGIQNFRNLTSLEASGIGLNVLPNELPETLKTLDVSRNNLREIANLPGNIDSLCINDNQIESIDNLPDSLRNFKASNNNLVLLPNLGNNLEILELNNNQLIDVPHLPDSIIRLEFNHNNLINIPNIPENISNLSLNNNRLTSLPHLPDSLIELDISHNDAALTIPNIPESLMYLDIYNIRITRPFNNLELIR